MDFVERWLGISPDGGNGMLEVAILLSLAAALAAAAIIGMRFRHTR
jgi:hypothetical protein